ncbi:MAG TPA: hypothetical protein VGS19_28495 [Streptosporangiaceae bacterium]|nr:hypothetical protein [Streptosporangiaceae bacterium]
MSGLLDNSTRSTVPARSTTTHIEAKDRLEALAKLREATLHSHLTSYGR